MPDYLLSIILLFIVANIYEIGSLPSHFHTSLEVAPVLIHQKIEVKPTHNSIQHITRKKKARNIPYQTYLVQNLHVIPIQHQVHTDNVNNMAGKHNVSQQLIPVLIPIHNYVPVQDLTVIPLHRVRETKRYDVSEEVERYRNPLGGYGVGWPFGGHGAGHGFHYTYYI